ncbi:Hsp70 family protein [Evansella halocellulosilytica]|uniref:Hsp70 family protein n=1 Tax=Evansella halocellulosilytica TaxID=2011013 RepID=UPI000BB9534B|nr:Hsp70 family protein [Evansella halocellulosilytica]
MTHSSTNAKTTSFRPIIGIDLGTTNTAAAYIYKQSPRMIQLKNGEHMMPSVVLLDPSDKVIVGDDARSALVAMPNRTKAAVKREMGEETLISLGEKSFTPEEISAFILKEIKRVADKQLGEGEKEAVITVPAYFTNQQRQATKKAGELAGFVVERIINEPTAAALAYGMQNLEENSHIIVYDLGGGTFDVSVVEMMDGILEVKASAGNNQLGGEDFDWLVVDWLSEKMIASTQIDPREDIRSKARLKEEAEKIKEKLSYEDTVNIAVPVVTVKNNSPIGLDATLNRDEFVKLIEPLLLETEEKLRQVLSDANLKATDIDEVLLVGGSTRIPQVHQLITSFFQKAPKKDVNPDEAVALGAAVQAGLKSGALSNSGLIVTDVAPFSMGIAVLDNMRSRAKPGAFHAIIPRNTTIPVTRTESFTTSEDNQTAVSIEIYQGENDWVKNNYFLNEFILEGLPAKRAGEEAVDVTFRYNLNGILEVTAKSASTGNEMSVTIEDAIDRSSEQAFQDSMTKVEAAYEVEDQDLAEELNLFDFTEDVPGESEEPLEELITDAKEWKKRFSKELHNCDGVSKEELEQVMMLIESALNSNDPALLNKAIERSIDLAIDLEI